MRREIKVKTTWQHPTGGAYLAKATIRPEIRPSLADDDGSEEEVTINEIRMEIGGCLFQEWQFSLDEIELIEQAVVEAAQKEAQ